MKTRYSLYTAILALSATILSPADVLALDVKVLSINTGSISGNVKAEIIDGEGRTVKGVIGRRYEMASGNCTERTAFITFGEGKRFISAEVDAPPKAGNDYFYQLEVTFDDDTVVKTDCFNVAMTEGAVWLSDIDRSDMLLPDVDTYEIGYDICPNATPGTPIQIHPNRTFGKGISLRSRNYNGSGDFHINTNRRNQYGVPFTYTKFTIGYQAYKADGSASVANGRMEFKLNKGNTTSQANMKAYSTAGRGTGAYYFDQTQTNVNGINYVGLRVLNNQAVNYDGIDNYANLAACRLYYPLPAHTKRAQTVTFDNPGGVIYEDSPEVEISAFTTGGTPISYSIIQGKDLAVIEERNDEYFLVPKDGRKGVIVVEAITMGDEAFDVASATQTYSFNFASSVEYLYTHKSASDPREQTVYLYVQPKNRSLETLDINFYDNVRSFNNIKSLNLTASDLTHYATGIDNIYAIPVTVPDGGTLVHEISYKFSGVDPVSEGLYEGRTQFVYLTDIPDVSLSQESGSVKTNEAYSGGRLANSNYEYAKGYGAYAPGYIETPETLDLSAYDRFCVDLGGQKFETEPATSGRVGYSLYNGISQAYLSTGATDWSNVYEWDFNIQSNQAGKTIRLEFDAGGDGNANDEICIGAPRFYYPSQDARKTQTISWINEETVNPQRTPVYTLSAESSSKELPVLYRIARGGEYATIEGDKLKFNIAVLNEMAAREEDTNVDLLIEAIQPGNNDYQAAVSQVCNIYLRNTIVIDKNARVELDGSSEIEELLIYADGTSSGQAISNTGILNVKRLVLKYTFVPGLWHHVAFPTDLNLLKISDLEALEFTYGDETASTTGKRFYIREYDSFTRSDLGDKGNPWKDLKEPVVKGHKGYIMMLETANNEPVEVTFVMNNISMDFEQSVRGMYLSLDMSQCEPQSRHTVYISPKNVDGNTLRVDVRYVPDDLSEVPVNHAYELKKLRVTRTPVRGKIRLMLPDQSYCRVGIYDKKGKKLLKAVNYVAPMQIDISDLKPDQYLLTVAYGPAYREMLIDL